MSETAVEYVEQTATGAWRITGSRVSLDSVVYAYWEGQSPEAIAEQFPNGPLLDRIRSSRRSSRGDESVL